MKLFQTIKLVLGSLLMATLGACGGGGDGGDVGVSTGTLRLALTDAPSCGYDAVNITVQKVRVHQSATAGDTDSGWSEMVLAPAKRVNLLTLSNGVLEELGQIPLPTGKYTQLRLVLASNDSAQPLANSVRPTGGAEVALKTPSGQQSGVKTNISIDIAANQMADFVLDFDACKSVVSAGNSGQYLLKPVLTVVPRHISGVMGYVDASLIMANTGVSVQQAGVVIKATTPDSTGKFVLQPVAPGSYTLVLTGAGRATMVVTNVPVAADTVMALNTTNTRLTPAVSASGTVNGSATLDTLVRATQTVATGTTVEVVGRFVDSVTGNYGYVLPVDAPLVAPYVVAPGVLVFVADSAAVGKYTLYASLSGFTEKSKVLGTLGAGATLTSNFTFP
ncbi:DUF4382 domain-containing protein [Rhodoferax sp.]|uniref:DUF4382 domain-containing protein n=1 Tax=Rhodoferax sp. TaxID=50421 RepID=UPI0027752826|nr:DUF4382 domain-containing protein [Rhodoferax sp.]